MIDLEIFTLLIWEKQAEMNYPGWATVINRGEDMKIVSKSFWRVVNYRYIADSTGSEGASDELGRLFDTRLFGQGIYQVSILLTLFPHRKEQSMPDISPVNPVRMISTVILIIPLRLSPPDFRVVFRLDRDHRIETDGFAKIETQIAFTSNFPLWTIF